MTGLTQRQPHSEYRALAGACAVDVHGTTVRLDDLPGDGETEPEPSTPAPC
jgi:hypothetical protein